MKKVFTSFLSLAFCAMCLAQRTSEKLPAWLVQASAAYQTPGGDLAMRFGENFAVGIGGGYKTKDNWIFSLGANYMFSNNVKDVSQLLKPILSSQGHLFNDIGNYAEMAVVQRGIYGNFEVSKTLSFLQANINSGPNLGFGVGYITHWVDISTTGNNAPQIRGEYVKGYDELSGGVLLKQSIGYLYLAKNRRVNFKMSFELMQAFTENLRGFSYSTGKPVQGRKLDLLYGIRFEWILPIYSKGSQEYFYD